MLRVLVQYSSRTVRQWLNTIHCPLHSSPHLSVTLTTVNLSQLKIGNRKTKSVSELLWKNKCLVLEGKLLLFYHCCYSVILLSGYCIVVVMPPRHHYLIYVISRSILDTKQGINKNILCRCRCEDENIFRMQMWSAVRSVLC